MRLFPRGALRRCLALLATVAFLATSPGLAGIEILAHLSGLVDLTHSRQAHFEGAGQTGHTDDCQLGAAAVGVRNPTHGAPTLRLSEERAFERCLADLVTPGVAPRNPGLPRAPPA